MDASKRSHLYSSGGLGWIKFSTWGDTTEALEIPRLALSALLWLPRSLCQTPTTTTQKNSHVFAVEHLISPPLDISCECQGRADLEAAVAFTILSSLLKVSVFRWRRTSSATHVSAGIKGEAGEREGEMSGLLMGSWKISQRGFLGCRATETSL